MKNFKSLYGSNIWFWETCLSARKTYLQRKRRHLQARRVHGFHNSLVLFNFICIEVDVLTLHLSFEIRKTMIISILLPYCILPLFYCLNSTEIASAS